VFNIHGRVSPPVNSDTAGVSVVVTALLAVLTVWFLWDLVFASVELLVLARGWPWVVATAVVLASLVYPAYRIRRYEEREY